MTFPGSGSGLASVKAILLKGDSDRAASVIEGAAPFEKNFAGAYVAPVVICAAWPVSERTGGIEGKLAHYRRLYRDLTPRLRRG